MTLDEWRAALQVDDRKSRGAEEFWALCPCHDDHDASLHVTVAADGGIRMKCFVCGAANSDVARQMDIGIGEALCHAYTGERLGRGAGGEGRGNALPGGRAGRGREKRADGWAVGMIWRLGKGKTPYRLERLYDYCTADGRAAMQKARLERTDGAEENRKSFAFRHLGTDGHWYSGKGIYGGLLYHLPQLQEARKSGRTVYVVEGEKDADNLGAMGYCAVSGAYGAGTGEDLYGKWPGDYTQALAGAGRVVVIPDNDGPGEALAQYVCRHLSGQVGDLRILRLADSLDAEAAKAFAKGDFTDWARLRQAAGLRGSAIRAEFDALSEGAPRWQEGDRRTFARDADGTPREAKADGKSLNEHRKEAGGEEEENGEPYCGLKDYVIQYGRLCRVDPKYGPQVLCDFVPYLRETVTRDDGAQVETLFLIGGTYRDQELPQVAITADELEAMKWPSARWDCRGNIRAKKGARDSVRDAIMRGGQKSARHRMIYGHTGMRRIGETMCYLYNGGAVGAEGVGVELKNNLKHYTLDVPEGASAQAGAQAVTQMLVLLPARIVVPVLAQAFLAPVYSELEAMETPPSYVVYVVGRSGSYKSTLVGWIEGMFGRFYLRQHTATFQETPNAVRKKTFYAKDALFVVDDYNPENDARRRSNMDAVAQSVVTAIADRADRSGLNAAHELTQEMPARCTCVMTGEQLPNLNLGRLLRLVIVQVAPGEIGKTPRDLEAFRDAAHAGLYRAAMRGYIEALLSRWDGMRAELRRRLDEAESMALSDERLPGRYARLLDAGAHLLCGCSLMIDYLVDQGAIDADMRAGWMRTCWEAICDNLLAQGQTVEENSPANVYMETVRSLVQMGSVRLIDLSDAKNRAAYTGPVTVGYFDENFYYFDAAALDRVVRAQLRDRGIDMGASGSAIRKTLMEQGICVPQGSNPCKVKSILGRTQRMLWIPRATIDSPLDVPQEPFEQRPDEPDMPF